MSRLALMIDLERCTGCKSCEAACKQTNALGPHEYRNRVLWFNEPEAAAPRLDFLTVTCQQCERPACLRACPLNPKALSKDPLTGVVSVDESRCTGCGECALACPYGAMGYDPVGQHAVKCDLCAGRRATGDGPACAAVCPTRAISYGEREELLQRAESQSRTVRDHDHYLQGPATVYLDRLSGLWPSADTAPIALMADHTARDPIAEGAAAGPYRHDGTAEVPERVVAGGCQICFNACSLKFHLRGNEVLRVYGNDEDPVFQGRVCPKSQMTLQHYRNPERLLRPRKRVGARGEGKFEEISWAQALDEIAEKLLALRERHGSETLAIHAGTRTGVLNIVGFVPLFAKLWGTLNTATTESFCDASKVVALEQVQGTTCQANIYTEDDIGSADLYVYIGDNQAETRPVNFGLVNHWRLNRGRKMVVVDPRLTATASKADRWFAIRPGTDMALGLALSYHVLEQGLHDRDFCERWTLGWREWQAWLQAEGYSPEWAAQVCDIDAADIRWLAEEIAAADGCMLFLSRGVNQHSNATQTNRVFMFLAAITGNWGRRGGGYFNVSSENNLQHIPLPAGRCAAPVRPAVSTNPAAWVEAMGVGAVDERTSDERVPDERALDEYPITALITGNNPLTQWPDQTRVREAFAELDLLVHMECFANETSAYADYVLPMASGVEKGGPSRLAEDRRVIWTDRVIDPPGEVRSDHWVWIELGKRLGFDDVLLEAYKDPAVFWDEAFRPASPELHGLTLKRLRAAPNRCVRAPLADENDPEPGTLFLPGSVFFGDDRGRRFPTESGKLEFYTEALDERFAAVGLSALPRFYTEPEQLLPLPTLRPRADAEPLLSPFFAKPVWQQPVELCEGGGGAEVAPEYDTELVTGRPPAPHFHSWTHWFWQAQEMWPEQYCQIHPDKAAAIGVADGDPVRVESEHGALLARAWVTPGIRPSAVYIPMGWGERQPFHPAQTANRLTALTIDPPSQQPNLKLHRCRVSAVEG